MAHHVVRSHDHWLQGGLPDKSPNRSTDKLTINLGSKKYVVLKDILDPYLNRMLLRARYRLLHDGTGLIALQKNMQELPGKGEQDWAYECSEIMRGGEKCGCAGGEWTGSVWGGAI